MNGPPPGAPGLHAALVRHTGYLLSRLGVFAQRQFAERLLTLNLTPRMWGALNVLEAEGTITQQALGESIGMDPSTMTATIDELEALGLAERRRHATDRRAHALHLTGHGRETLGRGRELARQAQDQLLAPLDAGDRERLHELLLRVAMATGAVEHSASSVTNEPPQSRAPQR
jgi:DNA-binding MarR family transcriptional regulator